MILIKIIIQFQLICLTFAKNTSISEEIENCVNISVAESPKVTLVRSEVNLDNPFLFNIVQFNCTAVYPIQWTFNRFPMEMVEWNVTYLRVSEDIFQERIISFNSTISFENITTEQIGSFIPVCRKVDEPCQATKASLTPLDNIQQTPYSLDDTVLPCTLDLWYESTSQEFICKTTQNSSSSVPKLSYRFCANPTECGFYSKNHKCIEDLKRSGSRRKCTRNNNGTSCTSIHISVEFQTPKVISCDDQEGNQLGGHSNNSSVKIMGYFHSIREVQGHPQNSYVSWEEANPEDLLSIQTSKQRVMVNEPFDVACFASYYYYAGGMHLTLQHLSDLSFTEVDLTTPGATHLSTVEENLEFWNHSISPGHPLKGIPIRRALLAQGLHLPIGDYSVTCYAPIWNTTEWVTKALLVSVANSTMPTFVTGNSSRNLEFKPRKNITCLAKGVPPPKLSWIFDSERLSDVVVQTNGQTEALSWSVVTLPERFDGFQFEFKCHAENLAGFDEKVFIINKDDESILVTTKIAACIVLLGFVANLIVGYFCWKHLFSDDETAALAFLRNLCRDKSKCCNSRSAHTENKGKLDCENDSCSQIQIQNPC